MSKKKQPRLAGLLFGSGLLSVAGILSFMVSSPPDLPENSIIWVYYTSQCSKPLDSSDCHEVPQRVRPAFDSLEACADHRESDLSAIADQRVMGSCLKQREA